MGLDRIFASRALTEVRAWVDFLRKLGPPGSEELERNLERRLAVLHALQLAIQTLLDVGAHVLASIKARPFEEYSDIGRLLGEQGILDPELCEKFQKMARFRNLLVHGYAEVDLKQVAVILSSHLDDIEAVEQAVVRFVDGRPEL